ncbi:MAG: DUF2999 domain-containing protein [Psychromonas sp.]|nr:DUF2999 domain-containing protein [Psychromonas sp.]
MNPIIQTLQELNVSEDKIKALFNTLTENPFMAMDALQQLGLPADKLQAIMMLVMSNPGMIKEAVEELGLDFSKVEQAQEKLKES